MENASELSERAWKMLKEQPRDLTGQPQTLAEIKAILQTENCPLDHPIIHFQLTLGGYKMTGDGCQLLLGFTDDSSIYQIKGHWYCEFAEITFPPSSPGLLVMDENGILRWDASNFPFSSSILKYVESKALEEDLEKSLGSNLYAVGAEGQLKITLGDVDNLGERLVSLGLAEVTEASDNFEHWWADSSSYVHAFRNWYSNTSSFKLFADTKERLEELGTIFAGITVFSYKS